MKRTFLLQHHIEDSEDLLISAIYELRRLEELSRVDPSLSALVFRQKRIVMNQEAYARSLRHGY